MASLIGIIVFCILIWFIKASRKCDNHCKLIFNMGKKRCGKTSDICRQAMKLRDKGVTVYTTEYIEDTYHIEPEEIGFYEYEPYSHVFIDEVGLIWHARNFKNFDSKVREWFKLQGHRHLTVHMYSQSFDIDKGLRDLCDEIYLMKRFGPFSIKKKIRKEIGIVEATAEAESRFVDNLKVVPFIIPGSRVWIYLPKYHKYFDSFAAPALKMREYKPLPVKHWKKHRRVQKKLFWMEFNATVRRIRVKILTWMYRKGVVTAFNSQMRSMSILYRGRRQTS